MSMGVADTGDTLVLRRGVHSVKKVVKISTSFTATGESTYAGGGGGGFCGGGAGGYGKGGGGGGGSFVRPGAQNVTIRVGHSAVKGQLVLVGNKGDGSVVVSNRACIYQNPRP